MLWDVDSTKIMENQDMLFDETFIMNPTWNGNGQIIKKIIDKTIDLGQIIGSNVGFWRACTRNGSSATNCT